MKKSKKPRRISDTQLLMYLLSCLIADRLIGLSSGSSSGSTTKRKPRKRVRTPAKRRTR